MVMVIQPCECATECHRTEHLKVIKIVSFKLCIFYHNTLRKEGRKEEGREGGREEKFRSLSAGNFGGILTKNQLKKFALSQQSYHQRKWSRQCI